MRRVSLRRGVALRSYRPSSAWIALLAFLLPALWTANAKASHGREEINYISADRIKALLDGGEKVLFVDIRPVKDYQEKHVNGARSVPVRELEKRLDEIPKAGRIVVYCSCKPGSEDADAYFLLRDNGYRNVAVLEEGFPGWLRRKFAVESGKK